TTVANWGWRGVTEAETGYVSYRTFQLRCRVCDPNTGICGYSYYPSYDTWTYHDSLGAGHGFSIVTTPGSTTCGVDPIPTGTATSTDGSGYTLIAGDPGLPTVYRRDGSKSNPPLT